MSRAEIYTDVSVWKLLACSKIVVLRLTKSVGFHVNFPPCLLSSGIKIRTLACHIRSNLIWLGGRGLLSVQMVGLQCTRTWYDLI